MTSLLRYPPHALTPEQEQSLAALIELVWPAYPPGTPEAEARATRHAAPRPQRRVFIIWDGNRAVAHAESFARTIRTPEGTLTAMALAGVCVDPACRGRGLGHQVVTAAFSEVEEGRYPLALFQTGVPGFYAPLGGRTVDNRFFNRLAPDTPETNPWWESSIMIYPATASWPSGDIDLGGPGY